MDMSKRLIIQYLSMLYSLFKCTTDIYYTELFSNKQFLELLVNFCQNQEFKEQIIYPCIYNFELTVSKLIATESMLDKLRASVEKLKAVELSRPVVISESVLFPQPMIQSEKTSHTIEQISNADNLVGMILLKNRKCYFWDFH
jgi:hypothetical protein